MRSKLKMTNFVWYDTNKKKGGNAMREVNTRAVNTRDVNRQTLNAWLDMCQHPEKYCESCGSLKKFCLCRQLAKRIPTSEIWQKHFGDRPAVDLKDTEAFFEELNVVCQQEHLQQDSLQQDSLQQEGGEFDD